MADTLQTTTYSFSIARDVPEVEEPMTFAMVEDAPYAVVDRLEAQVVHTEDAPRPEAGTVIEDAGTVTVTEDGSILDYTFTPDEQTVRPLD